MNKLEEQMARLIPEELTISVEIGNNKRYAENCNEWKWNYCKKDYIKNYTAILSDGWVVTKSKVSKFW